MSDSFSTLPKGTRIRLAAIAVLQAAGTNAGDNVLDTPLDSLAPDSFPVIAVTCTTDRQSIAAAGGPPAFRVSYVLHVGAGVTAAEQADAVQQADQLAQQIMDALLCDPVWIRLIGPVTAVSEEKSAGKGNPRYIASVVQKITASWLESYAPNATSVLDVNGEPLAAARDVFVPLESISDTLQLQTLTAAGTLALSAAGPAIVQNLAIPQS